MDGIAEPPVAIDAPKKIRRGKRLLVRAAIVCSILVLCAAFYLKDYIRTLHSLRHIPGTNAYVMDYYVDYNMAEVRARGIDTNLVDSSFVSVFFPKWLAPIAMRAKSSFLKDPIETLPAGDHCSTVVLRSKNGHVYFGRNLDYSHDSCLVLKIHGPSGSTSVAVLDLHYLNLDRDDLERTNLIQRIPLLFAPYYLQDGMNQYGVAVSDMSLAGSLPPYDPTKPNIIHSAAMRLILDYAHSTDEAVDILRRYNIRFVAERCHFMIADASGKSQIVEFLDGQLKTTPAHDSWQICTNHQISGKNEAENCSACDRYRQASAELTGLHGYGDATDVMKIMQSISKPNWTMWSSVYDLTSGEFHLAYRRHYEIPYEDRLSFSSTLQRAALPQ
jgi:hypothetical protein